MAFNDIQDIHPQTFSCNSTPCFYKDLRLQWNCISTISDDAFSGIVITGTLDLSHNNLTSLQQDVFSEQRILNWLLLNNNRLRRLAPNLFVNMTSLHLLDLSHNNIQSIKASTLPENLWHLCLSNNALIEIAITPPYLEIITLSHNVQCNSTLHKIRNYRHDAWSLTDLDLSYNHIYNMYDYTLHECLESLLYLYITHARLQIIGPNTFAKVIN